MTSVYPRLLVAWTITGAEPTIRGRQQNRNTPKNAPEFNQLETLATS